MFFTKYTRGRPKPPAWTPSMPLYVCEYRYKDDVKAFKKIKSWSSCVPEEMRRHEYDFEPFPDDRVDSLHKVKSPFVRGVAGPGRLDGAPAPPAYNFSQDGRPATAQEVQAEEAQQQQHQGRANEAQPMEFDDGEGSVAFPVDAATSAALASFAGIGAPPPSVSDLSTSAALAALSSLEVPVPATPTGVDPSGANAPAAPAPTPAELAAANESFAPLPPSIGASPRFSLLTPRAPP